MVGFRRFWVWLNRPTFTKFLPCAQLPFSLVLMVLVGLTQPTWAQFTGLSAELDTMLWATESPDDPLADLAYYGVYDVYANFTDSSDVLSAVYSDVGALGTPPMGIDAPCGCHNPAVTSITVDASNNPVFYEAAPAFAYDSFWTIGMETTADPELPSSVNLPPATELCAGLGVTMAHSTSRDPRTTGLQMLWLVKTEVLVARVTTCSDFSIRLAFRFLGGSQDSVQQACPEEPLLVLHQGCTEPDACNYNPSATTDDGTCVFDDGIYGCDGECITDTDVAFVTKTSWVDARMRGHATPTRAPRTTMARANTRRAQDAPTAMLATDRSDHRRRLMLLPEILRRRDCVDGGRRHSAGVMFGLQLLRPRRLQLLRGGHQRRKLVFYIALRHHRKHEPAQNIQDYTYTNTTGSSCSGSYGRALSVAKATWCRWFGTWKAATRCVLETNADGCSGEEVCFDVNITLTSVDELLKGPWTCSQCQP